jgi:hypothetical protein
MAQFLEESAETSRGLLAILFDSQRESTATTLRASRLAWFLREEENQLSGSGNGLPNNSFAGERGIAPFSTSFVRRALRVAARAT